MLQALDSTGKSRSWLVVRNGPPTGPLALRVFEAAKLANADEFIARMTSGYDTMVGERETTTNLIGNGVLTLLRNPGEMERLRNDLSLIPSAVEEMLRYESPSQHTARMCPSDREMGGKRIQKRQAVIAVMAAANRDPERFPNPDRFDITRKDNRHLAFGYAAHFCFGAPLARVEGQVVLEAFLRHFANVTLSPEHQSKNAQHSRMRDG